MTALHSTQHGNLVRSISSKDTTSGEREEAQRVHRSSGDLRLWQIECYCWPVPGQCNSREAVGQSRRQHGMCIRQAFNAGSVVSELDAVVHSKNRDLLAVSYIA